MTVPPVKSTPKLSPRVARKNTASRNVITEITLNTSAWRMNGMSLRILKNSMACIVRCQSSGFRRCTSLFPLGIADGQPLDLAPAAVYQVYQGTRHHHPAEHGGKDTQAQHYRKTAHRSAAEHEQRDTGNQRGDIRVENGAEGALVAGMNAGLRGVAVAQFLADALIDQHIGVNRHADGERDGGHAR